MVLKFRGHEIDDKDLKYEKTETVHIKDNFLPEPTFKSIQSRMMGREFPWYWIPAAVSGAKKKESHPQFIYMFYEERKRYGENELFPLMEPLIKKLEAKELIRIKANLTTRTLFHRKGGYHIDYPNVKTAVYYINTNNGSTQFQNGPSVESLENTMVLFNSNLLHSGKTCTDQERRVVINFNYI